MKPPPRNWLALLPVMLLGSSLGCWRAASPAKPVPLPPPPVVVVQPTPPTCVPAGPQPNPRQPTTMEVGDVLAATALTLGDAWAWMDRAAVEIACLRVGQ